MKKILAIVSLSLLFYACGSDNQSAVSNDSSMQQTKKSATLEAEIVNGVQIVPLFADDNMKYSAKEIIVKSGMPIELTFKHTGKAPLASMGHNVVILKPEVAFADFVERANAATATDYIPGDLVDQIVAHTKMLGGGESDVIKFTFNNPGTYVYFCSFPGHSMMMKGKFIVE